MSEHTAEPWTTVSADGKQIFGGRDETFIAQVFSSPEDAYRAAACVNACQGIPTADLEKVPERMPTLLRATVKAMVKVRTPEEEAAIDRDVQESVDAAIRRDTRLAEAERLLRELHDKMDDFNANTPEKAMCWFCLGEGYDGDGLIHKNACVLRAVRAFLAPPAGSAVSGHVVTSKDAKEVVPSE